MEGPIKVIAYCSVSLLALSVVLDALDDMALGGRWDGATVVLASVVTASLTALVTYRRRRNDNGNDKPAKGEPS